MTGTRGRRAWGRGALRHIRTGRPRTRPLALLLALLAGAPAAARAQDLGLGGPRAELRADLRPFDTAELGAAVAVPASLYLRVGVLASAGAVRDGDSTRATGRVEAFLRVPLDPLWESRWAPTLSGGAALQCTADRRCTPLVVLRLGLEGGRGTGGWVPAIEAGVGGGVRLGLVLRRARGPAR